MLKEFCHKQVRKHYHQGTYLLAFWVRQQFVLDDVWVAEQKRPKQNVGILSQQRTVLLDHTQPNLIISPSCPSPFFLMT